MGREHTQHDVGFLGFLVKSLSTVEVAIHKTDVRILARNLGTLVTVADQSCNLIVTGMPFHQLIERVSAYVSSSTSAGDGIVSSCIDFEYDRLHHSHEDIRSHLE